MRALLVNCVIVVVLLHNSSHVNGKNAKKSKAKLTREPKYVDGNLCNRECNGTTLDCYFEFRLETFYSMSKACYQCPKVREDCFRQDCIVGGGLQRIVMVINRQLPGPAIEVCHGDRVIVNLANNLIDGEDTTIHWHGQHMYGKDKYFDGVPFVTQCPIPSNNNFIYEFTCNNAGTHWYHSHLQLQIGDGTFGALICREPPEDSRYYDQYDYDLSEHVILVGDWNDELRLERFLRYTFVGDWLEPTGILINGLGIQSNINNTDTLLANFVVQKGKRYRFRLINVGFFDCPIEFSIDNHNMTIINTDGTDVEPITVDSFISTTGERYDFILSANQNVSTYWIRMKGFLNCNRLGTFTMATLQYNGSSATLPTGLMPTYDTSSPPPEGVILNPMSAKEALGYSKVITIDQLQDPYGIPYGLDTKNPRRFYVTLDMSEIDQPVYHRRSYYGYYDVDPDLRVMTPQFNRISYKGLDRALLPERHNISSDIFCDEEKISSQDCANNYCSCLHLLAVDEGDVVEFVFIELYDQDPARTLHPIHLHGYNFYVLGWGELGRNLTKDGVIDMDQRGLLPRNFERPPLKDTVTVPRGGYTIVRFIAANLGYWFLHCHIDVHAREGMIMILKVGEDEDMEDAPENYPKCGNWPS